MYTTHKGDRPVKTAAGASELGLENASHEADVDNRQGHINKRFGEGEGVKIIQNTDNVTIDFFLGVVQLELLLKILPNLFATSIPSSTCLTSSQTSMKEECDNVQVPSAGSQVERNVVDTILGIGVSPILEQHPHHFGEASTGCYVKGKAATRNFRPPVDAFTDRISMTTDLCQHALACVFGGNFDENDGRKDHTDDGSYSGPQQTQHNLDVWKVNPSQKRSKDHHKCDDFEFALRYVCAAQFTCCPMLKSISIAIKQLSAGTSQASDYYHGKRQRGKDTATDIRKQSFTDSARMVDGKATRMFPGMRLIAEPTRDPGFGLPLGLGQAPTKNTVTNDLIYQE
ncbi:unnamed protein product [Darwinula stevensoni]|uniref:Uncharacterized protein n=1 Tax=Darwinula stevensoni TaxID=69355 RepID=A0A7R9FPF2_9CRUS|nr:unnamed protein product [Darwinula stevensoni]CAG0897937.1 unnamed protein product [Darwinula stevensoni]